MTETPKRRTATNLIHAGRIRTDMAENSEALFLTSGFVYDSAEQAEAVFANQIQHYQYTRFSNPTVAMLEGRLAEIEGAEACRCTATGMAAVHSAMLSALKAGDRVVASRALFGSCHWIVSTLLPQYAIEAVFVDGADLGAWKSALAEKTALVLLETPSNPMLDIIDLRAVCEMAHAAGAIVVVDNVFATPLLQRPLEFGADVVVYSATKHLGCAGGGGGGGGAGQPEMDRRGLSAVLPQYRADAVAIQCLGDFEGAGDDGAAGACAVRQCRGGGEVFGNESEDFALFLSDLGIAPAAGVGDGANVGWRHAGGVRGGGRQGSRVPDAECAAYCYNFQ